MKHKLKYALLCALSLSALTVSAADSGNSDPLQLDASSTVDTLRCVNTMSAWRSITHKLNRTAEPPSYECGLWLRSEKSKGLFAQNYRPGDRAEYNAWLYELSAFHDDPRVRAVLKDYQNLVTHQRDLTWDRFARVEAKHNYDVAEREYRRLISADPLTQFTTDAPIARSQRAHCSEETQDAMRRIKDPERRAAALKLQSEQCSDVPAPDSLIAHTLAKMAKTDCAGAMQHARSKGYVAYTCALPAAAADSEKSWTEQLLPTADSAPDHAVATKWLTSTDVASVVVGADAAQAELMVVMDFSAASRLLVLQFWPAVRDGWLRLRLVPTSVGRDIDTHRHAAVLLATDKPYAYVNTWLMTGNLTINTDPALFARVAKNTALLARVAKNNELARASVRAVPTTVRIQDNKVAAFSEGSNGYLNLIGSTWHGVPAGAWPWPAFTRAQLESLAGADLYHYDYANVARIALDPKKLTSEICVRAEAEGTDRGECWLATSKANGAKSKFLGLF
jgi:hypothetical protein